MTGATMLMILKLFVVPFVAIFYRADPNWSYVESVVHQMVLLMNDLPYEQERRVMGFGNALTSRAFPFRSHVKTDKVEGYWYGSESSDYILLYVHGGGFVLGDAKLPANLFSTQLGDFFRIFSLEYRLAPEHPYPAAFEDVLAGYTWLLNEFPADRIIFAGDSAGGHLIFKTLSNLQSKSLPLPKAAIGISPWIDLTMSSNSYSKTTDIFTKSMVTKWRNLFVNETTTILNQMVIKTVPKLPILVIAGENELFIDEIKHFSAKHPFIQTHFHPYLYHVYCNALPLSSAGQLAIERMISFVKEC